MDAGGGGGLCDHNWKCLGHNGQILALNTRTGDETNQSVPWCLEVEQCAKNSLPTTSGASQKAVLVLTIGVDDRWYACSELDDGQKPLV